MGKVIAGLTISLDGFINDRSGGVGSLYPDFEELKNQESFQESIRNTGAVVMGRRAFEMGEPDSYADSYEYQAPIFVLIHTPPDQHPRESDKLTFTFVTDGIESAVWQAKAAAGDKDVTVVGGASTIQQCLRAGLVDELEIDIMPILLGGGVRLFDVTAAGEVKLEKLSVREAGERTQLRFRVVGQG